MNTLLSKRWLILFTIVLLSGPVARAQSTGPGSALNLDGASGYAQAANGVYFNGNFTMKPGSLFTATTIGRASLISAMGRTT